jgi:single-strand DNA-binding protein
MARSLNKLQIIGNVGADPEIRMTGGGTKVANIRVATNERWKDRNGTEQEHTEWHRVVFYGSQADIVEKYVKKGTRIYVEGALRTDKWQDKDGNTRYTTEVRGRDLILLDGRGGDDATAPSESDDRPTRRPSAGTPSHDLTDEDIPF